MIRIVHYLANVGGGFSAAFLMYVAISSSLGLVLSNPYSNESFQRCWPLTDPNYTFSVDGCQDPLSKSLWMVAVHQPRSFISAPAVALYGLMSPYQPSTEVSYTFYVISHSTTYTYSSLLIVLGLIGFLAWHQRSPLVAWSLSTLILSQIAFTYFRLAFFAAT